MARAGGVVIGAVVNVLALLTVVAVVGACLTGSAVRRLTRRRPQPAPVKPRQTTWGADRQTLTGRPDYAELKALGDHIWRQHTNQKKETN
jgi:class 3 adenylate cyclase